MGDCWIDIIDGLDYIVMTDNLHLEGKPFHHHNKEVLPVKFEEFSPHTIWARIRVIVNREYNCLQLPFLDVGYPHLLTFRGKYPTSLNMRPVLEASTNPLTNMQSLISTIWHTSM